MNLTRNSSSMFAKSYKFNRTGTSPTQRRRNNKPARCARALGFASGENPWHRVTNLLNVFHYHVDFFACFFPHSHIKDVDDIAMLQRAQDGYFSERGDRNAIATLVGRDPDLLQGDHLGGCFVPCTIDHAVSLRRFELSGCSRFDLRRICAENLLPSPSWLSLSNASID